MRCRLEPTFSKISPENPPRTSLSGPFEAYDFFFHFPTRQLRAYCQSFYSDGSPSTLGSESWHNIESDIAHGYLKLIWMWSEVKLDIDPSMPKPVLFNKKTIGWPSIRLLDPALPYFGNVISDWHRWFTWFPVQTFDGRWRFLRSCRRRRVQLKPHLDRGLSQWWQYAI